MYPVSKWWDPLLRKHHDEFYITIENIFYSVQVDSTSSISQISRIDNSLSLYFSIITKVGLGVKGKGSIQKVHIRFRLLSLYPEIFPEPEIAMISPTDQLRKVGLIQGSRDVSIASNLTLEAEVKASTPAEAILNPNASASVQHTRKVATNEKTTYEYDNEIQIINASGVGNLANWEFYQGKGRKRIGQYNLEIVFRIPLGDGKERKPEFVEKIVGRRSYYIDWNIEVNGRKVIDHDWDLTYQYWNIEVNGQKMRDHETNNLTLSTGIPQLFDALRNKRILRPIEMILSNINP